MHMMIDIETLGTLPGSVITQIGYSTFDPDGRGIERTQTLHVDPQTCFDAGLVCDWDTLAWWMRQSEGARSALVDPDLKMSLAAALVMLNTVYEGCEIVWAKPPQFDLALLAVAADKVNLPLPWHHRDVRDMRTLLELVDEGGLPDIKPQLEHEAGSDAEAQALRTQRALKLHKSGVRSGYVE